MSLDSLPVITCLECDTATNAFLHRSLGAYAHIFNQWKATNEDFSLASQIVFKFRNQQRHFVHFRQFCQVHLTQVLIFTSRLNAACAEQAQEGPTFPLTIYCKGRMVSQSQISVSVETALIFYYLPFTPGMKMLTSSEDYPWAAGGTVKGRCSPDTLWN